MDELQQTLLLGRRVEIHFNRFRNAGRHWVANGRSGDSEGDATAELDTVVTN